MKVGGFAEPRKILCQCAYPPMGKYQNITGRNSPTIGIRAHGLKGCLILLKNKNCQNCVLTIPLCRGGRDEATGENGVKIGRRTWPHSPSLSGKTFAHAPHASSSPRWADPTHVTDPDMNDVSMNSRHARDDISMM